MDKKPLLQSEADTDWVIIGRFGRPHGIKGLISVYSFTEPTDNILAYLPWHAKINQQWQPITCLQSEITPKFILVQIEGYREREQVACLTNCEIAVPRTRLPPLSAGEYYWHQLIGLQVITMMGQQLGQITEILPTGANDVLVVQGEQRHLIPYVLDVVIKQVDIEQQQLIVDWDID